MGWFSRTFGGDTGTVFTKPEIILALQMVAHLDVDHFDNSPPPVDQRTRSLIAKTKAWKAEPDGDGMLWVEIVG